MTGRIAGAAIASMLAGTAFLTGCVTGPSTKEEVCATFDELGRQVVQGNGIIGNPLFRKADQLGDVAGRYEATDLSADADALHRIAESDRTTGMELMNATTGIAGVCGHPLATNALFGESG